MSKPTPKLASTLCSVNAMMLTDQITFAHLYSHLLKVPHGKCSSLSNQRILLKILLLNKLMSDEGKTAQDVQAMLSTSTSQGSSPESIIRAVGDLMGKTIKLPVRKEKPPTFLTLLNEI